MLNSCLEKYSIVYQFQNLVLKNTQSNKILLPRMGLHPNGSKPLLMQLHHLAKYTCLRLTALQHHSFCTSNWFENPHVI